MLSEVSAAAVILAAIICVVLVLDRVMTKAAPPAEKTWLTDYQYAHRGLHNEHYPENSLPAFANAMKNGVGIELDVHRTSDGVIVVFHDSNLKRMTGVDGKIKDYTFAQLRKLRLAGTEYTIPTLRETLALIGGRVPLLIEIKRKGFAGDLERELYDMMQEYGGKYAVQSFSPFSVRWFKKHAPDVYRGQLSCNFSLCKENFPAGMDCVLRFILSKLLIVVQRLGVNFICRPNFISYEFRRVDSRLIRRLRRSGAPIFAWTVRSREDYERAKQYTDSIIFENFTPKKRPVFWNQHKAS